MPFTDAATIQKAVGGATALATLSSVSAEVDNDAIDAAILQADADITAACSGRPGFDDPGFAAAISPYATDLAIGYLYLNIWGTLPEAREKSSFERAKKFLQSIRDGHTSVISSDPPAVINASSVDFVQADTEIDDGDLRETSLKTLKCL